MSTSEVVLAVIGSVGGASALIVGLSAWLGRVWADRILEGTRASNAERLEAFKTRLTVTAHGQERLVDARLDLYFQVWTRLQDVRTVGDQLWLRASQELLEQFVAALAAARIAVNRGRLILTESQYRQLDDLLKSFEDYQVGKIRLVQIRSDEDFRKNLIEGWKQSIRYQIKENGEAKARYERLLDEILVHFKAELGLAA